MSNPGEMTTNPVPGFNEVLNLAHEYGSIARIPDEILTSVGYFRSDDGTLAPVGHEFKYQTLADKNARKPFEPFSVEINTGRVPRMLDAGLQFRVSKIDARISHIVALDTQGYDPDLERLATQDELDRAAWLHDALPGTFDPNKQGEWLLRTAAVWNLTKYYPLAFERKEESESTLFRTQEPLLDEITIPMRPDGIWPIEATVQISEIAERRRGKQTDLTEICKEYDTNLGFNERLDYEERSSLWIEALHLADQLPETVSDEEYGQVLLGARNYKDELLAHGIDTKGKLINLMVGELLDDLLPGVRDNSFANETLALSDSTEVAVYLRRLEKTWQEVSRQELRAAKDNLRSVAFGDERRSDAESRLHQAKHSLKSVHLKLLPLIEAFERPTLVARRLNRLYDELQQAMYASSAESRSYTFMSDIDEEKDADPGKISGDCTEGKPLPFLDPNNNLYNVKVFREGEHVGNVYLLQVQDSTGKPIYWHLDAIQIPQYLDWSVAAPAILEGFKRQAQSRGVTRITMNSEDELISNYDYIAEAFRTLAIGEVGLNSKLDRAIRRSAPQETSINELLEERTGSNMQLHQSNRLLRLM